MSIQVTNRAGERGFTLIELAIVLVVIGVLIGAVLQGQSLIESSRIKTTIAQVDGARGALSVFRDRFGALPGDYNQAVARLGAVADGNANGVVGAQVDVRTATLVSGIEQVHFWNHLVAANLLTGPQAPDDAATPTNNNFGATSAHLRARLPGLGFVPVHGNNNIVWFAMAGNINNGTLAAGPSSNQSFEIDQRYDDGSPAGGFIQANTTLGTNCVNGAAYGTGTCVLLFRSAD